MCGNLPSPRKEGEMIMKKNVASLLLALVLCLSLLPTAVLAEGPATGLYTEINNGAPAGQYTEGSRPVEDGPWGYWDIPYTSGSTTVLYYYDAGTTAFTCNTNGISISSAGDHLWKIEISMQAGYGDFTAGFDLADGGFPISFKDQYTPPAPTPGLYYKELVDGPGDPPHEDGSYIPMSRIDCAPFVDRLALALYYYDGTSYTPVERVRLPQGSAFDLMRVSDWWGNMWGREWGPDAPLPEGHWYYLSAFDFSQGALEWFADPSNDDPTDCITLNSHHLPGVAFYSEAADPSEDTYRMYALMEANTSMDEDYRNYRYSSTLYVLSTDAGFTFSEQNDITCYQKHYDQNGFETGETPYENYTYTCDYSANMLTFTIYANDSDLLVWLEHGPRDYYGAYVNFLADTGSGLYFNLGTDQGFEAAKYLPSHLFRQVLAADGTITLRQAGCQAAITCDQDMVRDIAGQLAERQVAVCFSTADLTAEQAEALDTAAGEGSSVVDILDLNLAYGAVAQHELAGTVSVSYPYALSGGTQVKVYYLDGENTVQSMDAVYRDGQIVFSTDHFSKFAIVTVPAPSPSHDDRNDSTPSYQVKIDAEGIQANCRTAEAGELVTLTVKEGYDITGILVTDRNGNRVEVTCQDGKYTFRMPRGKITVTPIYAPAEPVFADVDGGHWASGAIRWAAEKGYMTGISDTVFAPEGKVSRQQVWMILARLSGAAPAGMAEARVWAMANGISDGTAPGAAVTRQQMVTLLYRYAVLMGYDVSVGEDTNILSYEDALSVSEYAVPAFQWACGAGIIDGTTSGTLAPQGNATRAQFAVILSRFCGESV